MRRFHYGDAWIRQRLTGHSDAERTFSYAGMEPFEFPTKDGPAPINYQGTLRLMPIIDGDRTFIEWSVEFGSNSNDSGQWMALLQELIPLWVDSLRRTLAGATLK